MVVLFVRKAGGAVLILALLNALGFWYALQFTPRGLPAPQASEAPATSATTAFVTQYRGYLQAVAQGDFGDRRGVPVTASIGRALRTSALLVGPALVLVLVLGVLLGMAALGRGTGRLTARAVLGLTTGAALPGFFVGSLLILLVLYGSRLLGFRRGSIVPIQGFGIDAHLVLPLLAVTISPMLYIASITAGAAEHELQQDYLRVAHSKGLSWRRLRWQHAFPNIAGVVAVSMGHAMRLLLTQLIVVEALFDWPGVGSLFLHNIRVANAWYTDVGGRPELLAAIFVVFGFVLLLADGAASLLAYMLDPRRRMQAAAVADQ